MVQGHVVNTPYRYVVTIYLTYCKGDYSFNTVHLLSIRIKKQSHTAALRINVSANKNKKRVSQETKKSASVLFTITFIAT